MIKFSFTDKINEIDAVLKKKRGWWKITSVQDIDYDDVCQIIRIHIYKKWDKWDQSKPLEPWVDKIIRNQIINLKKSVVGRYARPCENIDGNGNPCAFNLPEDGCSWTSGKSKCSECPHYKKWILRTQNKYNVKFPQSIDHSLFDEKLVCATSYNSIDAVKTSGRLHVKMKEVLSEKMWQYYDLMVIKGHSIDELDKKGEKLLGRQVTRRQLNNIKDKLLKAARIELREMDLI